MPAATRSIWSRAALCAGTVQLAFVAFGAMQAYLMVHALAERFGDVGTTRERALRHAFEDGVAWGIGQVVVGLVVVAVGWIGRRPTRGLDLPSAAWRVAGCALFVFVAAQAFAYGLTAAIGATDLWG